MKKDREEEKNSKILPNNQIITACCIEIRVQELTMNKKLTMIGLIYFNENACLDTLGVMLFFTLNINKRCCRMFQSKSMDWFLYIS